MTVAAWISIFGIGVAAAITLGVAYMQRKQMRQIELFRKDPKVPLTPPPHRVTLFLKDYWYFILIAVFDLAMLVRDMSRTTPITRSVVFSIGLDLVTFSATIVMAIVTALLRRMADVVGRIGTVMEAMSNGMVATERAMQAMDNSIWKVAEKTLGIDPKLRETKGDG
jgi:hypothetical protein